MGESTTMRPAQAYGVWVAARREESVRDSRTRRDVEAAMGAILAAWKGSRDPKARSKHLKRWRDLAALLERTDWDAATTTGAVETADV